jgi:hypothetical protein
VSREPLEALLVVVRNEGNSDDEVPIFIDSFLVAKTFQNTISQVTIPAGQHTIWFSHKHDYYGESINIAPNSLLATKQFVLNAYAFDRVSFDSLNEDGFDTLMKSTLPKVQYKYYDATQKTSTPRFKEILKDFEKGSLNLRDLNTKK